MIVKNFGSFVMRCKDKCWFEPVGIDEEGRKKIERVLEKGYTTLVEITCGSDGVKAFVVPTNETGVKIGNFLRIRLDGVSVDYNFPCVPTRIFLSNNALFFEVCGKVLRVKCKTGNVSYVGEIPRKIELSPNRFYVHAPKKFLRVRKT